MSEENDKIYCGYWNVPKNKRRGTPEECAKLKQVRYYGKHRIDPNIMKKVKEGDPLKEEYTKLMLELAKITGHVLRINKKEIPYYEGQMKHFKDKNIIKYNQNKKEYDARKEELQKLKPLYIECNKKIDKIKKLMDKENKPKLEMATRYIEEPLYTAYRKERNLPKTYEVKRKQNVYNQLNELIKEAEKIKYNMFHRKI